MSWKSEAEGGGRCDDRGAVIHRGGPAREEEGRRRVQGGGVGCGEASQGLRDREDEAACRCRTAVAGATKTWLQNVSTAG
ncbi:hypothetical protein SCP_0116940 [Sparassis crispa]|uniref:Uncharacterized protein n=1 Tax=Sparassis crispa TaxID=139825 RepID=A0A401G9G3_9APHY|nr:hypothetical protein SCP_0116940 [Sparassis crispa]GBE78801.1 hypothetical protein SCP_0116940 [Sparassis crispa]